MHGVMFQEMQASNDMRKTREEDNEKRDRLTAQRTNYTPKHKLPNIPGFKRLI